MTLNQLTQLDFKHNLIQKIPENINELKNLKVLDISSNKIETLPDQLWFLPNLWFIQIANNPLSKLYSTPAGLNKIKKAGNKIHITDAFFSISNLQLNENLILLSSITGLRTLDLNYANLFSLANISFKNLRNLRILGLSGNKLTIIRT